jgi:uncharacterized LabA/DUF88 family protein
LTAAFFLADIFSHYNQLTGSRSHLCPSLKVAVRDGVESATVDDSVVHIFWDNSNLFHRAQDTCDNRKDGTGLEPGRRWDLRLKFPALFDFARAGRTVTKAVAAGSVPPDLAAVWDRLGDAGFIVELQERGAMSGKEQGVDQALQLEMMNSAMDSLNPAVAVLLSGDGDFYPSVDRMLKKGWGVEVLSFSNGFSPKLRQIGVGYAGRGRYVELDAWYAQLTYLQDPEGTVYRAAGPLDLEGRPKV